MRFDPKTICYFPTTAVLIDDDKRFLQSLGLSLDSSIAYSMFDDANSALNTLSNNYQRYPFIQRCINRMEEEQIHHRSLDVDIPALHEQLFNPERFQEVSVIVVDYAMPGMNGLELCKRLQDTTFKKILLTGQADESIAIQAFNDGIIDKFIRKNVPDIGAEVSNAIKELQFIYFQQASSIISNTMTIELDSCIDDPAFKQVFKQICERHHVAEYYLLDSSGSFLLVDNEGQMHTLLTRTEEDMETYIDIAQHENAPAEVLTPLKERQKIPYFQNADEVKTEAKQWGKYLHTASTIKGRNNYYYAVMPFNSSSAHQGQLVAYSDYLKTT